MNASTGWRMLCSAVRGTLLAATAVLAIVTGSMEPAQAMDTDIFAATTSSVTAPNVLIILDNTSNWSRQDQHFPGGITQGQAEVDAIKSVLSTLPGHINVGIMEFATLHNDTGGFIRYAISPVGTSDGTTGTTNRSNLSTILTTIYNNINDPKEKVNSGQQYGDLMNDAYNYLSGLTPFATSSDVDSTKADSNGYVTNYTKFKSPLSSGSSCGTTYIVFIGNPNARGPVADSAANLSTLKSLGGDTTQLPLPNYSLTTSTQSDNIGYSSSCYTSAPSSTTDSTYQTCAASVTNGTYSSCSYSASDTTTALSTCSTGSRYSVVATVPNTTTSTTTTTSTATANSSSCYASSSNWTTSDTGGLTCPANTTTTSGNTTTATSYSCSYAVNSTAVSPNTCSSTVATNTTTTTGGWTSTSSSCYTKVGNGSGQWNTGTGDNGTCKSNPADTTSNGVTTSISYTCTPTGGTLSTACTGANSSKNLVSITNDLTTTTKTTTPNYKYTVTQTITKTVTTTTTTSGSNQQTLGNTLSCYSSLASCSTSDYTCPAGATCACSTPATTTGTCPAGSRYQVLGNYSVTAETPINPPTYTTDTATYNADEWARFLHQTGVPVGSSNLSVNTYTIDVYNAQPNATQSGLLSSMARNGGGKYFTATTESAIITALQTIFAEIQAVNNTFASAALPISATNRAQNSNQVYIGMFRPDQGDHPRWFGNLKRYQIANIAGFSGLAGSDGNAAVSNTTGFVTPCAVSWWTTSSSNYWYDSTNDLSRIFITQARTSGTAWDAAGNDDNFSKGTCSTTTQWSDSPDGPTVEKGGVAQMIRNNFASRKLYTVSSSTSGPSSLSTFDTSVTGLSGTSTINSNIAKFIMGQDVTGEISLSGSTSARPSIHGDVIHSRPLPVDYGGNTGVVIYYGANDGVYRAVSGSTGTELWSFVAPESYSYLQRLMDNTPLTLVPNPTPPGLTATANTTARDFFFDGSTGVYQNSDSSKVWIYPSMRRGGRMLYAFDVTTPGSPTLKWRRGCPNLSNDTGCTTGLSGMGQTWSTPAVAKVNGYKSGSTYNPVIIVGGGYDTCEDSDAASPTCSTPKGAGIYILDADTGTLITSFATTRSVAADIALVDIDNDGIVDYAYAADTGGNVYRIKFPSGASDSSGWTMVKAAYTNVTVGDSHRKFLFAPAVLPYKNDVYVAIVSGDREHPLAASYPYTTPVLNRAYVYLDDPTNRPNTSDAVDLDGVKMLDKSATTPDCSSPGILPGGSYYGWHMDLKAGTGEQGVTTALIFGGMVTFSTNRPTASSETCSSSLGEARGYLVNLLNGSGSIGVSGTCGGAQSSVFVGGGLPPSAVAATVSVNGTEQTILIGAPDKTGGTSTSIGAQQVKPPINSTRTRTYWKTNIDNK